MQIQNNNYRGVIPPYILQNIYNNDNEKKKVLMTLNHTQSLMLDNVIKESSDDSGDDDKVTNTTIHRSIHDAENKRKLPGKLVRDEGDPDNGDKSVDNAYRYLEATYNFYKEVFNRNSLDDKGMKLIATVHYGEEYMNAFWGNGQMVFGDGDGKTFNDFTTSVDVIGHELSHGVIEKTADLVYFFQSGALNESIADVFGSLVKQHYLKQKADEADWVMGSELLGKDIKGVGIRSLKKPGSAYDDETLGKDPQPGHMDDYKDLPIYRDNGGVHINSGIPNKAFYNLAIKLGGYAWEKAGKIWYNTLLDKELARDANFVAFAKLTIKHARELFDEDVEKAAIDSWTEVGVKVKEDKNKDDKGGDKGDKGGDKDDKGGDKDKTKDKTEE
ncbi:peptidase M4 family protein [Photorhabdus luminescens]|uniref:Neutral metalloproteinase n=1 Tax=Photorhabdus aegyptia TaxID=2805098 RepID=A0A022PCU2_9GAMM|nr:MULTISPECIES: metalloprotease PrtS [Photorhabdus]EYU13962.1 Zinc metalloprotease (elastase) [Photorhabdus aegyptia]MBS9429552.1 peptidase M4 family protein [Photorhabdus akhurstii]PQQ26230.1 peptidase M4 family protein [Photorhabdus luminescens]